MNFPFQIRKKLLVQLMSFHYITETIAKWKNYIIFQNWNEMGGPHNTIELFPCPIDQKKYLNPKNENEWICLKVQLMSFCYMNVETINIKIYTFFQIWKKNTSPANEFLLHKHRNKKIKINVPFKTVKNY